MKIVTVMMTLCTIGFGQILDVDSILSSGTWSNSDSVLASDDMYGTTGTNNDELILEIADPVDTNGTIDSVIVCLEQYVSDESRAAWYIRPYFLGSPGTVTPDIMGTEIESTIMFNISTDISGWSDIFDLEIGLRNIKIGGGQNPDWFADYIYVQVFSDVGIHENESEAKIVEIVTPTIIHSYIRFTLTLTASTGIIADIYDIAGEKQYSTTVTGKAGTCTYSINTHACLTRGVYYLVIRDAQNRRISSGKFVVIN
jgi:hypothetical protein